MVIGIRGQCRVEGAGVDLDVGEFKALPEGFGTFDFLREIGGEQRLCFVVAAKRQQQFDAIEADCLVARIELAGLDEAGQRFLRLSFRRKPRGLSRKGPAGDGVSRSIKARSSASGMAPVNSSTIRP